MRNLFHRTIGIALPLLLCNAFILSAQDRPDAAGDVRLGLSGGVTYTSHPGLLSGSRGLQEPSDPVYTQIKMLAGYSIGATASYALSETVSLSAHVLYATHPGEGKSTTSGIVLLPGSGSDDATVVEQTLEQNASVHYGLLEVDVMAKVRLLTLGNGGAGLALGGSLGYPITLEDDLTMRLIDSRGVGFANPNGLPTRDSGRVLVLSEGERRDQSPIRLGLRGGLFYDIPAVGPLHLTPGVYFDYGLTDVLPDTEWKMNAWIFRVDLATRL